MVGGTHPGILNDSSLQRAVTEGARRLLSVACTPRSFSNVNARVVQQIGIENGAGGFLNVVRYTPSWHCSAGNIRKTPGADVYHPGLSMFLAEGRRPAALGVKAGGDGAGAM